MPSPSSPSRKASRTLGVSGSPSDSSGSMCCASRSGRPGEGDVVGDDGVRTDRHQTRVRQVQTAEGYLVAPDRPQEVFKDLDRELLAWTAAITEAEWRKPRVVADRQRLAVDHAEHRAKRAIRQGCVTAVVDLHRREIERAFGEADLLALRLVNLSAGRHIAVTARVELLRIGPVPGIEAGRGMRRYDVAASFVRQPESNRGRYAVAVVVARTRLPRIHDRGNASAIRRDRAE